MESSWFIIASGPSLIQEDVDKTKGYNVLVINDNYLLAPWAKALYACDQQWWLWHENKEELLRFKGDKYTQNEAWEKSVLERFKDKHRLNVVTSKGQPGLSTDPSLIHQGSNSGYQAINLAYHFGAKRIILLGYDMQFTHGKSHWFGDHPNKIKSSYGSWLRFYSDMAKQIKELDLEIINCTRETALTCFPCKSLEEIL